MPTPPSQSAVLSPAPSSPYYNALVSAYQTRVSSPSNLRVISTQTKHSISKKLTRSEEKRIARERRDAYDPSKERWWDKGVAQGGSSCSPHQKFLADGVSNFTGIYKQRFIDPKGGTAVSGDYHSTPRRVATMLINRSYKDLNIMDRSADFRAEVGFRTTLRDASPSAYQIRQMERRARLAAFAKSRQKVPRNNPRPQDSDSVGPLIHFMVGEGLGSLTDEEVAHRDNEEMVVLKRRRETERLEKEERVKEATEYIKNGASRQLFIKKLID